MMKTISPGIINGRCMALATQGQQVLAISQHRDACDRINAQAEPLAQGTNPRGGTAQL